jgi:parallel beta-helix repeat protein
MTLIANTCIFKVGKAKVKHQMLFVITAVLTAFLLSSMSPKTVSSRESSAFSTRNRVLTNARTIVVPDHFNKIQDAINNASDGDAILVKTNIYHERVVVNKSVYLLGEDKRDTIIDGGGGDVITIVTSKAVVSGFTIQNPGWTYLKMGIRVSKANNGVICNNIIKGNFVGVKLGDEFQETFGNVVRGNNITQNRYGVFLAHSKHSIVDGNIISDSGWNGVEIDWGEGNIVCGNTICNSVAYGLEIAFQTPSYYNIIFHNNFVNNAEGCTSSGYENSWDDGYPSGGNFWNDYPGLDLKSGPNQNWLGCDGIGDTPYLADQSTRDGYPLISPIFTFNADKGNTSYAVSLVSNSTIFDFGYNSTGNKLSFQVDGANGTFGFCRICIPHGLMIEPYSIAVDGCNPIFVNYALSDNGTHRWIYFVYQHSAHEVVIIPEFPMMILPFSVALTAVALAKIFSSKLKKLPVNLSYVAYSFSSSFDFCFSRRETYSSDIFSMFHSKCRCLACACNKLKTL